MNFFLHQAYLNFHISFRVFFSLRLHHVYLIKKCNLCDQCDRRSSNMLIINVRFLVTTLVTCWSHVTNPHSRQQILDEARSNRPSNPPKIPAKGRSAEWGKSRHGLRQKSQARNRPVSNKQYPELLLRVTRNTATKIFPSDSPG